MANFEVDIYKDISTRGRRPFPIPMNGTKLKVVIPKITKYVSKKNRVGGDIGYVEVYLNLGRGDSQFLGSMQKKKKWKWEPGDALKRNKDNLANRVEEHYEPIKESKEKIKENLQSFYQYMQDFYGQKGIYPDKRGRPLKVNDINVALSVYLKKYSADTFTGDSLDRERVRDILIKMKKIDPQYKKNEGVRLSMKEHLLTERDFLVYDVQPKRVEAFLKKYKKVEPSMKPYLKGNLMKAYVKWLDWKGKNEDKLGGRPEKVDSDTFGSKTFYKFDGLPGWANVFQYLYKKKNEIIENKIDGVEVKDEHIKAFIDKAIKLSGIKVVKYQPMKKSFIQSQIWGGFYTVKSANGTDVLPFYVNSKGMIDLGVSSDQFIVGKFGQILKVIKNLKSFKKTDLDQKYYEESFGRGPAPTPKGYDAAMKKMLKYMQGKAENYYKTELPKLYDMGAWEYPDLLRPGIKFDKIVNVRNKRAGAVSFFVDRATGDIYKPASFRAPAKGVRGNIFKSDTWKKYDVHGGWLYRYR